MPPRFLPRLTDDRAKALMPASTALGSSTASVFETAKPGTVPWAMPGMAHLADRIDDKPLENPVYSPVDLLLAPRGATGARAILEALIVDPAISIGADYVMDAVK